MREARYRIDLLHNFLSRHHGELVSFANWDILKILGMAIIAICFSLNLAVPISPFSFTFTASGFSAITDAVIRSCRSKPTFATPLRVRKLLLENRALMKKEPADGRLFF